MKIKSNKVFKIEFSKYIDLPENDEFKHPFYKDFTNCLDDGDDKLIGFANNNDIFLNLFESKVNIISNVFRKYGFEFKVVDVTDKVINGYLQKDFPEVEEFSPNLFNSFRINNTSIDQILDKISYNGINSLDNIDKLILKS
jgi:hypothetical protein